MSGIEVAGLVLGALPILFAAVDFSKDGFSRAGVAFRKRKNVEKLAYALLLQQQTLEETVKSVLMASGCEEVWRLDDDPHGYLAEESVQEEVLDYLGAKNEAAFTGALEQSNRIVRRIAKSITGLVPAFKGPPDDLLALITTNQDAHGKRIEFIPRVKLAFSTNDLKDAVKELDDTAGALDRFTRLLLSNRRMVEDKSSKQAVKLAKALRHVRQFAGNLSAAILQGWRARCHSIHEARLFLEDRVDTAPEILKQIGKENTDHILAFQVIFAAGVSQEQVLWHEAIVQVFNDTEVSDKPPMITQDSSASHVSFSSTITTSSATKPKITSIVDICSAIERATCNEKPVTLVISGTQPMGTISTTEKTIIQRAKVSTMTLRQLLSPDTTINKGLLLPLKLRMLLALRLASSLLQLLQTQWLLSTWSKDMVSFQVQPTANGELQLDLGRPFVFLTSNDSPNNLQPGQSIEPKIALLELGILLLEVWHQSTLEMRFGLEQAQRGGYYQRLALAVEWLDDTNNPLPDLYDRAVSHCIQRPVGEARCQDWDDIKFWGTVCREVVEPLSKNCRQWR